MTDAMRVRKNIFLVDDDADVSCALSMFLVSAGYSVKSFPSAEAFLEEAGSAVGGVMLLDQRMTGMSGIELQSELPRRGIFLPIIFITGHGDVQTSVKALKAGAIDFLEKPFSHKDLLASLKEAFLQFNNQKQDHDLVAEIGRCYVSLTRREKEVMQHVVAGVSNRQLAERLQLSPRTIEVYRSRVMKKMGAEALPNLVRIYDICEQAGLK